MKVKITNSYQPRPDLYPYTYAKFRKILTRLGFTFDNKTGEFEFSNTNTVEFVATIRTAVVFIKEKCPLHEYKMEFAEGGRFNAKYSV